MELVITEIAGCVVCAWFCDNTLSDIIICGNRKEYNIDDIYIGKVKNIVNNINASFVDIGGANPCFMQCKSYEAPLVLKGGMISCKDALKREQDVIVQIIKDSVKTKNQAVTSTLSIPGRYLILTRKKGISISRKIKDRQRRNELKELFDLNDEDYGFIVRTNAEHASDAKILEEKRYLSMLYKEILDKAVHSKTYTRLYKAPPEYIDAVKNSNLNQLTRIVTDIPYIYDDIMEYVSSAEPEFSNIISFYDDRGFSLDALFSISDKIKRLLKKKVWLDSGAYLIIDVTEACIVIDVNSGKAVNNNNDTEQTFFNINIEAANEIMRQLRLRNLSGIIIIDFIDMRNEEHNDALLSELKHLSEKERISTNVLDMTSLGLIEMTRMKQKKPLHERLMSDDDRLLIIQ